MRQLSLQGTTPDSLRATVATTAAAYGEAALVHCAKPAQVRCCSRASASACCSGPGCRALIIYLPMIHKYYCVNRYLVFGTGRPATLHGSAAARLRLHPLSCCNRSLDRTVIRSRVVKTSAPQVDHNINTMKEVNDEEMHPYITQSAFSISSVSLSMLLLMLFFHVFLSIFFLVLLTVPRASGKPRV